MCFLWFYDCFGGVFQHLLMRCVCGFIVVDYLTLFILIIGEFKRETKTKNNMDFGRILCCVEIIAGND